jgi:hypothetical protein
MNEIVKLPHAIWKAGWDKWEEGEEWTEENWRDWWICIGKHLCSFCNFFDYTPSSGDHKGCPLHDTHCADEYERAVTAVKHNDFPAFHAAAVALRARIANLPHEEEP